MKNQDWSISFFTNDDPHSEMWITGEKPSVFENNTVVCRDVSTLDADLFAELISRLEEVERKFETNVDTDRISYLESKVDRLENEIEWLNSAILNAGISL